MYIPKNRVQTDLYTNGSEYVFKNTSTYYKGFYWKTFKGEAFTGKSPSFPSSQPLEKYTPSSFPSPPSPTTPPQNNIFTPESIPDFDESELNTIYSNNITEYNKLKLPPNVLNNLDLNTKYLPIEYYPSPTEKDYELGAFVRYFVTKINEFQFIEVSKEIHNNIKNQDPKWFWEMYTPFMISWVISGIKEEVYNINKNTVLLIETRLKKKGISRYLKEDYLKFYK